MARIFISYKRVDKDKVFCLRNRIEAATGEKCWIDLEGIESDAYFEKTIIKAINDCDVFLFAYSSAHQYISDYENDYTIREIHFANSRGKRIVFINLDNSDLSDYFEFKYGLKQHVNVNNDEAFLHLLDDLCKWLGITNHTAKVENIKILETPTVSLIQPQISTRNHITAPTRLLEKLTFVINEISFDMIKVEGGTFIMGATSEQGSDAYGDEKPTHRVTLSDYYIGKYEVTQALWEAVMGTTIRQQRELANSSKSVRGEGGQYPMYYISWDECQEFIERLNNLLQSQLGSQRFALPTEAQWEYAARGGRKSQTYKYAGSNNLSSVAWYSGNSGATAHAVGTKAPNELGLYDMSGNVWEWCQDWYGSYSSNSQSHPIGLYGGSHRVNRGGSWRRMARRSRVSNRNFDTPSDRYDALGFRLVLIP